MKKVVSLYTKSRSLITAEGWMWVGCDGGRRVTDLFPDQR